MRDRRIITVLCWTLCALVAIVPNVLMLLRGALATRPIAVEAVAAVVFAGTAIYVQRVELPRLRRERAELG